MNQCPVRKNEHIYTLNMGPQHPSTHGVLRIILELDGEYIITAEPVLGYIHRMHEKMGENRPYPRFIANMSRLDYVGPMLYNHLFTAAVEKLSGMEVPPRAEYIRIITSELSRIASHLLWMGAFLMDLGAFTPILYTFDDREAILDLLESVCGARITFSYFRFGGVCKDISADFIEAAGAFIKLLRTRFPMYEKLVTKNIIFENRVRDIGIITPEMARLYGVTGPALRGSGISYDIRKNEPYSIYPEFEFEIPCGENGDCFDRYIVRMLEMEQSLRIIEQALDKIPDGPVMAKNAPLSLHPAPGETYFTVESARGEAGILLISDGSDTPYRLKLRTPGFSNLSILEELAKGTLLSDLVAIMGSLDLVIPEIDR